MSRAVRIWLMVAATLALLIWGGLALDDGWWALGWLGYPIAGGAILSRRPGNRVGRLSMAIGLAWGLAMMGFVLVDPVPAWWVETGSAIMGYVGWIAMVALTLAFPTGELSSPLSRFLGRTLVMAGAVVILAELVNPMPKEITGTVSPMAVEALAAPSLWVTVGPGFLIVPLIMLGALVDMVRRWRHSGGSERLQYQWFGSALVTVVLGLVILQLTPSVPTGSDVVVALASNLIPLSIGIAITRHGLYEIDRVVSRTVSYTIVVGSLVGVYAAGFALLTQVLPEQSDLAVAASTLAVAGLFTPVRRRVQAVVDRRFNRSRYRADRVVEEFGSHLRAGSDLEAIPPRLEAVVRETLQPATVGVWIRAGSR